eukprot:scaffold98188_cov58-Phaeocystis_antarctica.AAC.5
MKITQEKKALELLLEERIAPAGSGGGGTSEAEVAALRAQAEQLQRQLSAKTLEAAELEEELEGAKEEVLYWKDEAEASAAQAKSLAAGTASQRQVADLEKRLAEARDSAAADSQLAVRAAVAGLEKEKGDLEEEVAYLTKEIEELQTGGGGGGGGGGDGAPMPEPGPAAATAVRSSPLGGWGELPGGMG